MALRAAVVVLGAVAGKAAAKDPNPIFPKVRSHVGHPRKCRALRVLTRCAVPQAWHADYDYVATGEITQDGNGTLTYDLTGGNGKERSCKPLARHERLPTRCRRAPAATVAQPR